MLNVGENLPVTDAAYVVDSLELDVVDDIENLEKRTVNSFERTFYSSQNACVPIAIFLAGISQAGMLYLFSFFYIISMYTASCASHGQTKPSLYGTLYYS